MRRPLEPGSAKRQRAARFYIGIDLGDKYSDVCVLDSAAEVSQCLRLRMKPQDLQAYFTSIRLQDAQSALHLPK
jgi:hypothetical protein